jgi:L-threonylcarbamoyladenylate synthase
MREAQVLREGGVGVVPTDTLYGLVASADHPEAVARVYALKQRDHSKPCIVLIASIDDLASFDVTLSTVQRAVVDRHWPGPVSMVLTCGENAPACLHAGTHTIAFRLPADAALQALLRESGPLIAPSANPEGLPPATTIAEAQAYFGDRADFYIDGGTRVGEPSLLISVLKDGSTETLRPGRGSQVGA